MLTFSLTTSIGNFINFCEGYSLEMASKVYAYQAYVKGFGRFWQFLSEK